MPSTATPPRLSGVFFRAAIVTFLGTLLTFTVSLFFSIAGTALAAGLRGRHPDMAYAYRHLAYPIARAAFFVLFVGSLVFEFRRWRRERALHNLSHT